MIATNHRVNTLKIDTNRLVLTYFNVWCKDLMASLFSDSHLATPDRQSSIDPLFLSLNSLPRTVQRSIRLPIPRWRGSWQ